MPQSLGKIISQDFIGMIPFFSIFIFMDLAMLGLLHALEECFGPFAFLLNAVI
jgi:hypothetical protein